MEERADGALKIVKSRFNNPYLMALLLILSAAIPTVLMSRYSNISLGAAVTGGWILFFIACYLFYAEKKKTLNPMLQANRGTGVIEVIALLFITEAAYLLFKKPDYGDIFNTIGALVFFVNVFGIGLLTVTSLRYLRRRYIWQKNGFMVVVILAAAPIMLCSIWNILAANGLTPAAQQENQSITINAQRQADVNTILSGINSKIKRDQGKWICSAGSLPSTPENMASQNGYDIAACLIPEYISYIPANPSNADANWQGIKSYNSGYYIVQFNDGSDRDGYVGVAAPATESNPLVSEINTEKITQ